MAVIAVIDYGMGNLRSVAKALERMAPEHKILVSHNATDILRADRVVFPGQGAIGGCMHELQRLELVDVVRRVAVNKPFLGLCLGPQALFEFSEENEGTEGLGIIHGQVLRFSDDLRDPVTGELVKIPHMGWNKVHQTRAHPLWKSIPQDSRFYFVHSYYLNPTEDEITTGVTYYVFDFTSAISRENIFAVQFHPEKSARAGLQLLANFACWDPA